MLFFHGDLMTVQDTSLLSWVELQPSLGEREALVYHALQQIEPATDREIAAYLHFKDPNMVRPRRKGLFDKGMINAVEKRACKITGKTVIAWETIKPRW